MGFSERSTKRIISAVKRVESMPLSTEGTADSTPVATAEFWVELTVESSTNPGRYKWKKVYPSWNGSATTYFADTSPAITSGAAYSAICPNGTRGMTGSKVCLRFCGYESATSTPFYLVVYAPAPSTFWAKLTGSVVVTADKIWKYTWREQQRTATSFQDKPTIYRVGTAENGKYAYNSIEAWNASGSVTGNSIWHASGYPTGWSMQPASRGNAVVRMAEEIDSTGTTVYTFEYNNAEDGAC